MLVSTALTVTHFVPQTVKASRVTYKMERVSCVTLGGLGHIVIQVRLQCACLVIQFTVFNSCIV